MSAVDLPEKDWRFIFLFGVHRSGSTWVGKIFDSHPQTLYRHEPDTFSELPRIPWVTDMARPEACREEVERFLNSLPEDQTSFIAGSLPVFHKTYRSKWQDSAHLLSVMAAKIGRRLSWKISVHPYADYASVNGLPVVWKSICSLTRLGVLLRVARPSKAVILLRHPCAVIASQARGREQGYLRTNPSKHFGFFGTLLDTIPGKKFGITVDDLRGMEPEERLAWRWILTYEKAIDDIAGFEGDVLIIRYEDICADPKTWSQKMFEHCGLPWHSQTEAFLKQSTSDAGRRIAPRVLRSDYFSIFKDPMVSATKWRRELEPEKIERILRIMERSSVARLYLS